MFDIGWTEMAMVALVALLVIGPRDLPKALHTIGRWVGRARAVVGDFQRGLDDMVRETELDEMRKQIESAASVDINREIENSIDPTGEIAGALDFSDVPSVAPDGRVDELPPTAEDEGPATDVPGASEETKSGERSQS